MQRSGELLAGVVVFAFLIICFTPITFGQERKNLNGQNIQLQNPTTVSRARQDYSRLVAAQKRERMDFAIEDCDFLGSRTYKCIAQSKISRRSGGGISSISREGGIRYYVAPFPLLIPQEIPSDPHRGEPVFDWAPISEAFNGTHVLENWKQLLRAGNFFNCNDAGCTVLVRGLGENEQIAACSIDVINNQMGAPSGCLTLAIIAPQETWVRVVAGFETGGQANMGRPDFDISINFQNRPIAGSVISAALAASQQGLANPPFSLSTTLAARSVLGVAAYRVSPILPSSRELVTLRVDVSFDGKTTDLPIPKLGLAISSTLYVNRQNTQRPEDWHLPSPQQEQSYLSQFKATLKRSIQSICRTSTWTDDSTLMCESR